MNACPTAKRLQQWLAGVLSEAESQAIEEHVVSCADVCQPLIDSFSGFEAPGSADAPPAAAAVISPEPDADLSAVGLPAIPTGAKADETPALRLPGYDILCQLGKGGMGVVYKARHRRMDRLVAIKVLPAAVTQSPDAVARFEREVKAAARLRHPNIVDAHDAAEANGVHFLVMEYIQGSDLAALVRHKGPFEVSRAVDCVLQVARGLDYAHRQGVVHRDVKPSNLLLDGEGVVKVLDMGLARFETTLGAEVTELTGMGQIMGTVDYMAPEQALDTRHADARSDIYSLGVTLWYLLTGRPAFFGENALARLLAHREQPIPSLHAACPAATPALEAVFMKMVAKKPEDRYQTMSAVIAALEGCRRAAADERTFSWPSSEDGLPRPSGNVGWDQRACERRPTESNVVIGGTTASAVPAASQQPGAAAVLHAAPSVEATLTLNAAESDTDPNTEQSLDVSAGSLASKPPRRRGRKLGVGAALVGLAALAAAAIVIRIQTDEGEVVVESEVDGVSLDILRNGQPVKDDWQIHAGGDNRWHVRTGKVDVRLPANLQGEFTLEQDNARLVRDGKIVVKITRKRKADATTVAGDDPNRAVAEWALERGVPIGILSPPEAPAFSVTSVEQLPSSFDLFSLGFPFGPEPPRAPISEEEFISQVRRVRGNLGQLGADGLSDAGLRELTTFPALANLELLAIRNGAITDEGLARLSAFAKLRNLSIVGHLDVTPNGIAELRPLPKLKVLVLNQTDVSDAHLAELRGMDLQGLSLAGNREVTASGMNQLIGMRNLQDLRIQGTQVPTSALPELRQLPRLHWLLLSASQADDDWQGLRPLRMLRWLGVTEASSRDVTHLAELPQLRTISFYDDLAIDGGDRAELARKNPFCRLIVGHMPAKSIGADHPRALAERLQDRGAKLDIVLLSDYSHSQDVHSKDGPVSIESIGLPPRFALDGEDRRLLAALERPMSLSAQGVSEADLCAAALGETPTLVRSVDLSDSDLTDEGLARLSTQPMLERLQIRGTKVTSAGVEAFKKALPDCNVEWEPPTLPPQAGNRAVAEWVLKHGGTVAVVSTPGAPASLVTSVEQLPSSFDLYSLWSPLSPEPPRPPVSEEELISQVRRVRGNLGQLGADHVGLSDAGLRELTTIPALASLDLLRIRDGAITDAGLARLNAFANLHHLTVIGHLDVTPNGIAQLRALPKLKHLELDQTGLSDAHLAELRGMDLVGLSVPNHPGITGLGMSYLVGMRNLQGLRIQGTQVPTSALRELRQLPRLYWLVISASQADDNWEGLRPLRMLRRIDLGETSSRDLTHLAELPQLRTIWIYNDVAIDEAHRAELARKNPLCRVIVGYAPAKMIGEDHMRELAERLQDRGAKLELQFFADFARSQDVHSNDGPVLIESISLPPKFALDDEDRRLLAALDYPMSFSAPGVAEADRCAAALGETPTLLTNLDLSDSGLTDEGLARLSTQPMLASLHIRGTKVTAAGVEAFKKALPDCNVDWQPPTAATENRNRAVAE